MFTTPDNADAATTCPPFEPPGPHPNGFFQDCQTIPTAEDFNELVVNLRALLAHAGVPGVKGDPTMLWRCILALIPPQKVYTIDFAVTLHVAPGGAANPFDPVGGEPFDNLASALRWLAFFSITPTGFVTIQLATAFYYHSAPIVFDHPNGDRINILGGDPATTLLYFNTGTSGLIVTGYLGGISNLTIFGTKAANTIGLYIEGHCNFFILLVQGWERAVYVNGGGFLYGTSLWVNDSLLGGLACDNGGAAVIQAINCLEIGFGIGAPFWVAGVNCTSGGTVAADSIATTNCHKAVDISGAGSELIVHLLHAGAMEAGGIAVEANNGGVILTTVGSVAGDWKADAPGYFYANYFGLIRADSSFDAYTRASCSPAINVLGNVNAIVTSV